MSNIVVIGDIAVDIVSYLAVPLARGSDAAATVRLMPGGSGANVAVWLARLGQPVTFIGRVGDDFFGRWLRDDLAAEGVQPALITDRARGTGVIQVLVEPGSERTMIPDRGANAYWEADEIAERLIAQANLLHVVGYVLLDAQSRRGALHAMALARRHGVPISLDPSSHAPLLALGVEGFWPLIGGVTILLPNRREAEALTEAGQPEEALARLAERAAIVAIKLDRDGCLVGDGRCSWRVPAPPTAVANATGAGDAFNAAFLARWLAGDDLAAASRAGVALGSFAVSLPTTR
jgi:sugar/nucleoside kinase (ribokinase family)